METLESVDALEVPADLVAVRRYSATLTPGDGRTVDLRIVPYGERVQANDGLGGVPRGVVYTEEFAPGVFDHEIKSAHRVLLDFEHSERLDGIVGRGLSLESRPDGFHGAFRMLATSAGDTALALVNEGVLTGASVECRFLKSLRGADGVVRRVKAKLIKVALCRDPAYPSSVVLGVRTLADVEPATIEYADELKPKPFDPELALRISALGITIPDRLVADTSQPDPSASADPSGTTPPDGDDDNVDNGGLENELGSGGPARSAS